MMAWVATEASPIETRLLPRRGAIDGDEAADPSSR
jgi:hypothetical protein